MNPGFQSKPSRRAILIAAPGQGKNFLQGVTKDVQNFSQFLQSDQGGAWNETEITVLYAHLSEINITALQKIQVDYSLVYFSGHGCVTIDGAQMIALQGKLVAVRALLNQSSRQLVITDACRTYMGARISGPEIPGGYLSFEGTRDARRIFDQYIVASPPGITFVYATQRGTKAFEHSAIGGYFTRALIDASLGMRTGSQYLPVSMEELVEKMPPMFQRFGAEQIPQIERVWGNLQVPFALSACSKERSQVQTSITQPTASNLELAQAIAGLFFLTAIVIAASK